MKQWLRSEQYVVIIIQTEQTSVFTEHMAISVKCAYVRRITFAVQYFFKVLTRLSFEYFVTL